MLLRDIRRISGRAATHDLKIVCKPLLFSRLREAGRPRKKVSMEPERIGEQAMFTRGVTG